MRKQSLKDKLSSNSAHFTEPIFFNFVPKYSCFSFIPGSPEKFGRQNGSPSKQQPVSVTFGSNIYHSGNSSPQSSLNTHPDPEEKFTPGWKKIFLANEVYT